MDNLAAVLHGPLDLRMEQIKQPVITQNDVLLSMGSVGLCGSDLKYWKTGACGRFELRHPMVMGHEASGTVVAVGSAVTSFQAGDRVAIEPGVPCRKCKLCKHGRYNLCPDVRFCATPPVDGKLCRQFSHPADYCFKLPANVTMDEGAMMEPLAVAVYTCRRADVTSGTNLLICGAGPVGLLCMMVAKSAGASSVVITDIDDHRLNMAKALGADHVIKVRTRDPEELANQATESGGSVLLVGRGSPTPQLPITLAATREIDIKGIFRYANCYPTALSLLESRAFDVTPLITHHFSLCDSPRAFQTAMTPDCQAVKVMIHCDQ